MLPATLPDNACVVIRDTETYSEQVTVQNFAFTYGTNTLRIMADPTFVSSAPVINPPTSSTAAFQIANSSVTLERLNIVSTNTIAYGVQASSAHVVISSVNVDSNGNIWTAGIEISSWSVIRYASVTVQDAQGIVLVQSSSSTLASSTATAASSGFSALLLSGGSSNTITMFIAQNSQGMAARLNGSHYNQLQRSSFTTDASVSALLLSGSRWNSLDNVYAYSALDISARLNASSDNNLESSHLQSGNGAALLVDGSGAQRNALNRVFARGLLRGAVFDVNSNDSVISLSTFVSVGGAGAGYEGALEIDSNNNSLSNSVLTSQANHGLRVGGTGNVASFSSVTALGGHPALYIHASSNTFSDGFVSSSLSTGALISSAWGNTLRRSTITAAAPQASALYLSAASSNTIADSFIFNPFSTAAYIGAYSSHNLVLQSTAIARAQAATILIQGASSNTLRNVHATGDLGTALLLLNANSNVIRQSSMTTAANDASLANYQALTISGGSSNSIEESYFGAPDTQAGYIVNSDFNSILRSTFSTNRAAGTSALRVLVADFNVIKDSVFRNYGHAITLYNSADNNLISRNTLNSTAFGYQVLLIDSSANNTISDSVLQGNGHGIYVTRENNVTINSNRITSLSQVGISWPNVASANTGLSASCNTITAASVGIDLGQDNGGTVILSSNTILGARYGIAVATQAAGSRIWIGSNTIVGTLSASANTYGIYLNGLQTGATIQNNAIVFRSAGGASGRHYLGLYGQSVRSLKFDHNRINQPGLVAAGSFTAVHFHDIQASEFKFNDVNSTASATLQEHYLLRLQGSTVTVKNNIFFSSAAVSLSSASILADETSGVDSDYNNWYSSNAFNTFQWGAQTTQF
ncbi:MAG: right-handed parallel beta-helix repeat-containing protein, partial [Elusimicrobia bacterium]|nr:right-handed parallel beta-helix repeat-containing protein [Elusimicrobiota bacterium]